MPRMASRASGSSVFFNTDFRSRGYLVRRWCGFTNMSLSFRRLHCLCLSAHCERKGLKENSHKQSHQTGRPPPVRSPETGADSPLHWGRKLRTFSTGPRGGQDGGDIQPRFSLPSHTGEKVRFAAANSACIPCKPLLPYNNGRKAESGSRTAGGGERDPELTMV